MDTVGLVIITLSYCRLNRPSSAILHANNVFPEPACPANSVTVLSYILAFANFCSSFNCNLNLMGFFGILFGRYTSSVWGLLGIKRFLMVKRIGKNVPYKYKKNPALRGGIL